ncbi:MAG: CHRD domain-containing protein [Saprospiraceae bacterium]|nr:CHRD domain-containing protein [Saprospiraceae bacterium]
MKKIFTYSAFLLLMALFSFTKTGYAENGQLMFVATMSAGDEVPPVRSDALGLMTFLISEDRTEMFVHGAFSNLTGTVGGCHIHLGGSDTTGPVFIDLSSLIVGKRIKGAVKIPAGFFPLAMLSELYVNVHTSVFPNGEIRGQLNWKAELIFPAILAGNNEVPPVTTNGLGVGTFRFSQNLTRLQYEILPTGLSGPATAAHIHQGPTGANGPVIADLNAGPFIAGTIEDPIIVEDVLFSIFFTGAYVNIHTAANPGGEIRGQLVYEALVNGSGIMNGDQETPPVTTSARGYGYASLQYPNLDTIFYVVHFEGVAATAAHIHLGPAGKSGPVLTALTQSNTPNLYFGRARVSPDNVTAFLKDELYFNIHSSANPGGEIRGQIQSNIMKSFAFDLCGDQEIPVKNVNAYGAAYVAINKANTELDYGMLVNDLNGDATSAHIHDGAFGVNGPVAVVLDLPNTFATNVIPITGGIVAKLEKDGAYFNVHTPANPAGEVRGQIRRVLSCIINTGNQESAIREITLSNTITNHSLNLEADLDKNINAKIYVTDISGKHIMHWTTNFNSGINKQSYNVEKLSSGFYLLNIIEENNSIKSLKFVKQ